MSAWFKPKSRGYGNVPTTWQGWLVTIGFAAFVIAMTGATHYGLLSTTWCIVIVLAVTAIFVPFVKAKTDGEWRWR